VWWMASSEVGDGYNRRDGQKAPVSIREAIPKHQVFLERKFRFQICVDSSQYILYA
jgi:hypothetical protein